MIACAQRGTRIAQLESASFSDGDRKGKRRERNLRMTTPQETQRIVRTYHDAWVNGDFATAGSVLADELTNPHTLNKFDSSPHVP
jgi:hypothetical protein